MTSWIITTPQGQVFETFSKANADKAQAAGWKVETAMDYLGRVNDKLKEAEHYAAMVCDGG